MEPFTLGAIVAALGARALARAEDGAVDGGAGVLRKIVDVLRERFAGSEDEPGQQALVRLEEAPDSPSRVSALAELVDSRAASSADLREELEALVKQARAAGVEVDSIEQTATGDNVVQNAGIANSQINVSQGRPSRGDG